MSAFTRGSYFIELSIADLLFYRIPRILWKLLWCWPRAVLRLLAFKGSSETTLRERDIDVVYSEVNPHVAASFGLARTPTKTVSAETAITEKPLGPTPGPPTLGTFERLPPLRYSGPLYSGHIHTIFGGMRPAWHKFEYHRQSVVSMDGQHLNLDVLLPCMIACERSSAATAGPWTQMKKASGSVHDSTTESVYMKESVRGMLFIVPGLLNASTTNYVRNFAYQAASSGFAVAVLNYRGMGSTPLEVPRLFSATFTDDIRYVLETYFNPDQVREMIYGPASCPGAKGAAVTAAAATAARELSPDTAAPAAIREAERARSRVVDCTLNVPLIGVGFSLGGVTLIKYISEEGLKIDKGEKEYLGGASVKVAEMAAAHAHGTLLAPGIGACRLDAVIAVTPPYDLVASDRATGRWAYTMLYEKPFAAGFRKFVRHNQKVIETLPNVDGRALFYGTTDADDRKIRGPLIKTITSIHVFDELINAPHNGFKTPEEYYAAANSIPWLKHCRTPCVCLANSGDPVCGPPTPSQEWHNEVVKDNPNVVYVCFPVGGHLGFVGSPAQEVSGKANAMERFVLDCAQCYVETGAAARGATSGAVIAHVCRRSSGKDGEKQS